MIGFDISLAADGGLTCDLYTPDHAAVSVVPLVSCSRNLQTGSAAVFLGRLVYRDELVTDGLPGADASSTDAEFVLSLFEKQGETALRHLEGDFAYVIFDARKRTLIAARDFTGNWPLFWCCSGDSVHIGTGLSRLRSRLPSAELNREYFADFLMCPYAFGEIQGAHTVLEGIQRIRAGRVCVLSPDGRLRNVYEPEWHADLPEISDITEREAAEKLRTLLTEAIRERMKGEKVAAHLSGGMDSSSVVCLGRELVDVAHRADLTTLSLTYPHKNLRYERSYMEAVVAQGGPVVPKYLSGEEGLDFDWFDSEIPRHDEPYAGLFQLGSERLLMDAAREAGVSVILAGGGEEILLRNSRYHLADYFLSGQFRKLIREGREYAASSRSTVWSVLKRHVVTPLLPGCLRDGLQTLLHGGYSRWPHVTLTSIPPWIKPEFAREFECWKRSRELFSRTGRYPLEINNRSLQLDLCANDWSTFHLGAQAGIRIVHPFLDQRLTSFCLALPRSIRETTHERKSLLKAAMRGTLPESIVKRKTKCGFNERYFLGLRKHLAPLTRMVRRSPFLEMGIIDPDCLIQAMKQHSLGIGEVMAGGRINSVLCLIAWFDLFHSEVTSDPQPSDSFRMTRTHPGRSGIPSWISLPA